MANGRKKSLTPAERASLSGPRVMLEPGSNDWCYQTVYALQSLWRRIDRHHERYLGILNEADQVKIWEHFPPDLPYGSREAFIKAVGVGDEAEVEQRRALGPVGAPKNEQRNSNHDNNFQGGTTTEYLLARLERDHPRIYAQYQAGGYRSVRAAAIAAGIITPIKKHELPHDAVRVAHFLRRWFTDEELRQITGHLLGAGRNSNAS